MTPIELTQVTDLNNYLNQFLIIVEQLSVEQEMNKTLIVSLILPFIKRQKGQVESTIDLKYTYNVFQVKE